MKTPIIISIGIIAILIAVVLGYVAFVMPKLGEPIQTPEVNNNATDKTPVPDDTSIPIPAPNDISEIDITDWKVYRNEEFGFELKYPSALYFFNCSSNFYESDPLYVHLTPNKNSNCDSPYKAINSLIAISHVKNFNKNDLINPLDKSKKEENIIIGNKSSIQISGESEVKGDEGEKLSSEPIREMIFTVVPIENNAYIQIMYSRISSVKNDDNGFVVGEDLSKIYNQMLSTFRFTESSVDISDWKVYRNEEFGFELKYPKDYLFEDQTKWIAGDDPASHAWYTRTNFLLSYLIWGEVNLEILNTTDQNTIMSTGGWEFIKANGIKKIGDLDIYLYSIDSEVNNMQVILHDRKAYKFIHYIPEENFEKIISTFKFID